MSLATEENPAAYVANLPSTYDRRREAGGMGSEPDPLPGMDFRMATTIRCLEWLWQGQQSPRAVLDVAAGLGNTARWAKAQGRPPFTYHATEQSEKQCAFIRERVPESSVCLWRHEAGGPTLREALEAAPSTFYEQYPVVMLAHGPEHHPDPYALFDQLWELVRPGGFLFVVAARNDNHRTHYRKYTLDDLCDLCGDYAGFGEPIITWVTDVFADYYVAAPKPPAEGVPA